MRGLTGLTVYQNDSCKLCYFLLCCRVDRFKLVHDFRNSKTCTRVDSVRSNKMISKKCLTLALKGALLYFFFNFLIEKTTEGRKYLLNNTISYYVSTLRNSNDIFSKKRIFDCDLCFQKGYFSNIVLTAS